MNGARRGLCTGLVLAAGGAALAVTSMPMVRLAARQNTDTMTKTEAKKLVLELKAASSDLRKLARTPAPTTLSPAGETAYAAVADEIEVTADMIDQYTAWLEEQITSESDEVRDDRQLASIDFEKQIEQQQQNLQMLSRLLKMLHDSTMAIIRNIG